MLLPTLTGELKEALTDCERYRNLRWLILSKNIMSNKKEGIPSLAQCTTLKEFDNRVDDIIREWLK